MTLRRVNQMLIWFFFVFAGFKFISLAFLSQYFNYGAESISFASVLRIVDGLPYLPLNDQFPTLTNPYGYLLPYLASLPAFVITKINVLNSVYVIYIVGKFFILSLLVAALVFSLKPRGALPDAEAIPSHYYWAVFLYPLFWEPLIVYSFRPDLLAVLFELAGFSLLFWQARRRPILAGVCFLLAVFTKANHFSLLFASGASLLVLRRFKDLGGAFGGFLIAGLLIYFGQRQLFGEEFAETYFFNIRYAANHGLLSLGEVPRLVLNEIWQVGLLQLPVHVLAFQGLQLWRNDPQKSRLWIPTAAALTVNLVLGLASQVKIGAAFNYLVPYFLMARGPVLVALGRPTVSGWLKRAFLVFAALHCAVNFGNTVLTTGNFFTNYPWSQVVKHVEQHFPEGAVYSNEASAIMHFYRRSAIGPWDEATFTRSRLFSEKWASKLVPQLESYKISVAVIPGAQCETWQPSGLLQSQLGHLKHLGAKFKKICVFSDLPQ